MSFIYHDEDEWEAVADYRPCTGCREEPRFTPDRTYMVPVCTGRCNGSSGVGMRRRDPADVVKIKARRRAYAEEEILRQADAIRARRGISS